MRLNGSPVNHPTRSAGFTYIGLLIAVVILGFSLAEIGTVWRTQAQREREQELLFIGREFEAAIGSYYATGAHQYPQSIDDLLEDKRGPQPRHHLRKLYADPMTGAPDWTLIQSAGLGITGIASSSLAEPIKKAGFPDDEKAFADAKCYCDWQFNFMPRTGWRRRGAPASATPD
jgi:type II secretory pathway pseudopilin PulG